MKEDVKPNLDFWVHSICTFQHYYMIKEHPDYKYSYRVLHWRWWCPFFMLERDMLFEGESEEYIKAIKSDDVFFTL